MPDVLGSWASLSVRTSLELTARLYRLDRDTARTRAAELIDLVDLAPLAEQPSRVLSRGQKQRLSLARALVHDPRVLLLDEPASGLDPAARHGLRVIVRRLADEGRTVIVSSHVLAELEEMADDAVFLEAGVTVSAERIAATRTVRREWRIRSLAPDALGAWLRHVGVDAADVRADGPGLLVAVDGDEAARDLLVRLVTAGVPVISFAPALGDLEHTFLDLTVRSGGPPTQPLIGDDTDSEGGTA
jgi:ABC-type multidrug transport system ATPase subunit